MEGLLVSTGSGGISAMVLQSDGKIVVVGGANQAPFVVARYLGQ